MNHYLLSVLSVICWPRSGPGVLPCVPGPPYCGRAVSGRAELGVCAVVIGRRSPRLQIGNGMPESPMWSAALHPVAADGSGIQWVYTATGTKPLSAYPRPIMARSDVLGAMLLNGEWQFDGGAADVMKPPGARRDECQVDVGGWCALGRYVRGGRAVNIVQFGTSPFGSPEPRWRRRRGAFRRPAQGPSSRHIKR
jgi:hypothetical protein